MFGAIILAAITRVLLGFKYTKLLAMIKDQRHTTGRGYGGTMPYCCGP
jgi:hypothetical protein